MPSTIELRQTTAKLYEQIKALSSKTKEEERDFTPEEQDAWDQLNNQFDETRLQVAVQEKEERIEAIKSSLETRGQPTSSAPGENEQFINEARAFFQGESRSLEVSFSAADVIEEEDEERSLLTTTSGVSPGVIPISFVRRLREFMFEHAGVRQANPTVLVTTGGEPLRVPRATALPTAGIIGEGAQKTESLPTFSSVVLGGYKYANFTQLSEEFLQDEVVNVLDYLARANGMALGDASGAHYITGNGTSAPEGVVTALDAIAARELTGAATSGNVTGINPNEVARIYHSIASPYRARAVWLMNDASLAKLAAIRDDSGASAGTGSFMWSDLQSGETPRLYGRPIVTDPTMPVMAAGANAIVFGDFSGFYIRDVGGVRFERSDDYAFQNDLVSFRAVLRTDSKLVDSNGLTLWKNAAT